MIKVIARLRERIRERNETEIGRMEMGEREREANHTYANF